MKQITKHLMGMLAGKKETLCGLKKVRPANVAANSNEVTCKACKSAEIDKATEEGKKQMRQVGNKIQKEVEKVELFTHLDVLKTIHDVNHQSAGSEADLPSEGGTGFCSCGIEDLVGMFGKDNLKLILRSVGILERQNLIYKPWAGDNGVEKATRGIMGITEEGLKAIKSNEPINGREKTQTKVGIHVETGGKYDRKAYMKKYMAEYNKRKREAAKKSKGVK